MTATPVRTAAALEARRRATQQKVHKTECTREGSPFRGDKPVRGLAGLEDVTSAWVAWYNDQRLMRRLGNRPPAEAGAGYWASQHAGNPAA